MHTHPWSARVGRALLVALLLTGGTATATGAASDGVTQSAVSVEVVERVLAEQLDTSGLPGGAVAVASTARIDAVGVGTAGDERDVTAQTPFVIGSATKSFTALAVMQLVDAGRIDLDAPVRDYVPEFQLAAGQPVDDLTVRRVLQQTSGLDDLAGGPLLASAADGTASEAIAELKDAELASTPGETWRYANANYVLAGLVVERVSGLSYADYLQREIFTPLGMTHSSARTDTVRTDATPSRHRVRRRAGRRPSALVRVPGRDGADPAPRHPRGRLHRLDPAGPGALPVAVPRRRTRPDGARIVSAAGVRTLLGAGPEAHLGPWAQGQTSRYAMGWFVGGLWGEDAVFHPGNTPDTTTMLALFPDRDLAVAAVVNAGNELPVPGNPFIADRVTRNVVHAALGQPVMDPPSLWTFYLVVDLVALILVGAAAWGLRRALRAVTSAGRSRHAVRGWTGVLVGISAAGLLVMVPAATYGWAGLWTWAPDLAVVIAALALLLGAAAALRAIGLLRTGSRTGPAVCSPPPTANRPCGEQHSHGREPTSAHLLHDHRDRRGPTVTTLATTITVMPTHSCQAST